MSVDTQIEVWVRPLAEGLSDMVFYPILIADHDFPLIVLWLAIAALWFTFYLRLINLRGFGHAVNLLLHPPVNIGKTGEISHFKALSTAISGTVGVGNIGGVAVAITIGGPGAAFWLFMAGFLAMSTKFVECTLGVKYRRINADGSVSGGPMYYLERFFLDRNWPKLGKFFGSFYALALVA